MSIFRSSGASASDRAFADKMFPNLGKTSKKTEKEPLFAQYWGGPRPKPKGLASRVCTLDVGYIVGFFKKMINAVVQGWGFKGFTDE